MDLMTGLVTIGETLKIAKGLRNIDTKFDQTDLKLQIISLVDGIEDAQKALKVSIKREQELLNKIETLENAGKFEDENGLLFKLDESGTRVGEPYCNYCYVMHEKRLRLRHNRGPYGFQYLCQKCGKGSGSDRGVVPITIPDLKRI